MFQIWERIYINTRSRILSTGNYQYEKSTFLGRRKFASICSDLKVTCSSCNEQARIFSILINTWGSLEMWLLIFQKIFNLIDIVRFYQLDGAPAHSSRGVVHQFSSLFDHRLNSYLWGRIEDNVHSSLKLDNCMISDRQLYKLSMEPTEISLAT